MSTATHDEVGKQRQVVFWRLLAAANGINDQARNVETVTGEVVEAVGLPKAILDPAPAIETVLQRHPELKSEFADLEKFCRPSEEADGEAPAAPGDEPPDLRRALCFSKMLLNVFGTNTMTASVTAQQFNQWCQDVAKLEEMFGYAPGQLRGKRGASGSGSGAPTTGTGQLMSEEQLQAGLSQMEGDLIRRMALREVLKDDKMAAKLTPSMPLLEQLLHDKANLSDNALKNAKDLIRRYVDQLAEVLRLQVMQTVRGKIDRSVPPKRVFRNLDLKRTIWKNLTNWDPEESTLFVNHLYYRQSAKKTTPTRLVVVVDQSGSMVDAMVQCTILASIFATLPKVEVHLFAFDTQVLNLTPWVHDPFEVLMRTRLGGGTHINKALLEAMENIEEPRHTGLVLISDFYEGGSNEELFKTIKGLKDSGVRFIPVGAVTSSGYFSVCEWFRARLKELGTPVLSGSIQKLIVELKNLI
ncbi:MAG TPA: VWA domain-containing protein [Gemmataceae bacterium]|nr:VWA domain-containing protein [Gemmataceae bacterium]